MIVDLNLSFPRGKDGKHAPLPKQKAFMNSVLDPDGQKYVAYMGGV